MKYASIDHLWSDCLTTLLAQGDEQPSRDGGTLEVIGWSGTIEDPSRCWLTNERRCLSPYYAAAEVLWYMGGDSDVTMIKAYAPQYVRFAEDSGKAFGAYGERLFEACGGGGILFDQVQAAIKYLRETPDTRRMVLAIWRPQDVLAGHGPAARRDVPCTLTWQFLVRDNALHMIVTMRSQDVWMGMPYDVFWNCTMQRVVAWELGLELGEYHHQCGSLHLYDRHRDAAREAKDAFAFYSDVYKSMVWIDSHGTRDGVADLQFAARTEKQNREVKDWTSQVLSFDNRPRVSESLVALCSRYLYKSVPEYWDHGYIDPVLHRAAQLYDSKKQKGNA